MDLRSQTVEISLHLEQLLADGGLLDRAGALLRDDELELHSPELGELLGDYVENFAELRGLLSVGRDQKG